MQRLRRTKRNMLQYNPFLNNILNSHRRLYLRSSRCKLRLHSLPRANKHKEQMCYRNYKLVVEEAFLEVEEEGILNEVKVEVGLKVKVVVNDYPVNILLLNNSRSNKIKVNVLRLIVLYPRVLQWVDQVNNDVNLLNNNKVSYLGLLELAASMLAQQL